MIHGINLHNVVRSAITSIHPDENCILYKSLGQRNVKGKVVPVYAEPQSVMASFQPLDTDALRHFDAMNQTPCSEQVFLYSEDIGVSGQHRLPITRTGDIIQREDNTYWLVIKVLEDWTWDGWANVGVDRQTTPPDFSASEWSDSYDTGSGK